MLLKKIYLYSFGASGTEGSRRKMTDWVILGMLYTFKARLGETDSIFSRDVGGPKLGQARSNLNYYLSFDVCAVSMVGRSVPSVRKKTF